LARYMHYFRIRYLAFDIMLNVQNKNNLSLELYRFSKQNKDAKLYRCSYMHFFCSLFTFSTNYFLSLFSSRTRCMRTNIWSPSPRKIVCSNILFFSQQRPKFLESNSDKFHTQDSPGKKSVSPTTAAISIPIHGNANAHRLIVAHTIGTARI
jgi:hypothetical protein